MLSLRIKYLRNWESKFLVLCQQQNDIILEIQNALIENEEAKYYHRLYLVLLAVNGMPVKEIASLYNESPTTIHYWTKKVIEQGVESLRSAEHTGRKLRLSAVQLQQLDNDLQKFPPDFDYELNQWDGLILSRHLADSYDVKYSSPPVSKDYETIRLYTSYSA